MCFDNNSGNGCFTPIHPLLCTQKRQNTENFIYKSFAMAMCFCTHTNKSHIYPKSGCFGNENHVAELTLAVWKKIANASVLGLEIDGRNHGYLSVLQNTPWGMPHVSGVCTCRNSWDISLTYCLDEPSLTWRQGSKIDIMLSLDFSDRLVDEEQTSDILKWFFPLPLFFYAVEL